MTDLNKLAKEIHEWNVQVGWWINEDEHTFTTKLQMCITEVAEATEGERKDLKDDKLPHREMGEVELADTMIRLLDMAGRYDWEYCEDSLYNCNIADDSPVASCHFFISQDICMIQIRESMEQYYYSQAINSILRTGELMGYDIMGALYEKLEFNKKRADHKLDNRMAAGGKKF